MPVNKPKLLDLFCGVGGCSMGYHLAGFDVVGVDISPQPNYPFKFIQADALKVSLKGFDCFHASPPCQRYSLIARCSAKVAHKYPDLVDPVRQRLLETKKPYVMENVPTAPLINPRLLCGTMFKDLAVIRHRIFESSFWIRNLFCRFHPRTYISKNQTPHIDPDNGFVTVVGHSTPTLRRARQAMGIEWAKTMQEVVEAIPPVYTQYIGWFLRNAVNGETDYSRLQFDFLASVL